MNAKELAYDEKLGLYLWEGKHSQTGELGLWINSEVEPDTETLIFLRENKPEVVKAIRARDRSWEYTSIRWLIQGLFLLSIGPVGAVKFIFRRIRRAIRWEPR